MATYTSNYGWTKPSGSDNVDISVLNDNLDDQDSTIHDAFLNMAPPFSESSTYAVDDIVLYTTGLYKCHTAVTTPGSWTGSTNWQVYKLSEGGSGGGGTSDYPNLTNKPQINGNTLTGNKTTSDLGINANNVMMSDGVTSVENVVTKESNPSDIVINPKTGVTINQQQITKQGALIFVQLVFTLSNPTTTEVEILSFSGFTVRYYLNGIIADNSNNMLGIYTLSGSRLYIKLSQSISSNTVLYFNIMGFNLS